MSKPIIIETNLSERMAMERIRKKSGLSYMEVMHLIRLARDTDFDLEAEVDWSLGYDAAKATITKKGLRREYQ